MSLTNWCFFASEEGDIIFPIDIDETKTVGHLQERIKERKPGKFVDADRLRLYKVDINPSGKQQDRVDRLKKLSQDLEEGNALEVEQQLLEVYHDRSPGKKRYIIVQSLGQSIDPINPRRCPHS